MKAAMDRMHVQLQAVSQDKAELQVLPPAPPFPPKLIPAQALLSDANQELSHHKSYETLLTNVGQALQISASPRQAARELGLGGTP